jgi:hypothetical protein
MICMKLDINRINIKITLQPRARQTMVDYLHIEHCH